MTLDVVEAQARAEGRITPRFSLSPAEHQLGAAPGVYDMLARVTVNSASAQPIAVKYVEYSLFIADDIALAPKPGETLIFGVGVSAPLGPYPEAGNAREMWPSGRWKELDAVRYPARQGDGVSCDATTGTPSSVCQLLLCGHDDYDACVGTGPASGNLRDAGS